MLKQILKKSTLMDVLIIVLGAIAIIGIWRGLWNIFDRHILPNNFMLSQSITIIGGILILIILSRVK